MMIETEYKQILKRIDIIEPINYASTRNYVNGAVTHLSPYISRGVISPYQIFQSLASKSYQWSEVKSIIQQLAWREYFQRVWQVKKDNINFDLKQPQTHVVHKMLPIAVSNPATSIEAIDSAIKNLYHTGYMHNHIRLYVASIACNIGQAHWLLPAQWMYYHLLDADWASNACSWQWVCGTFSSKKYFANQENINKYCNSNQTGTFLDTDYEALPVLPIPMKLVEVNNQKLITLLPQAKPINIDLAKPILIYNSYNIDPEWRKNEIANRILLLEPSHFEKYPMGSKTIDFILALSKNIEGIQVVVSEFADFRKQFTFNKIIYKEHPLFNHYQGTCDSRVWMCEDVNGYFPSFFNYWKRCEPYLIDQFNNLK